MAKGFIYLTETEHLKEQVAEFVSKRKFPGIMEKARKELKVPLGRVVLESFEKTLFWKGMKGEFAGDRQRDVPAHLGLSGEEALQALHEIEQSLYASLEIAQIQGVSETGLFSKLGSSTQIIFNIGSPTIISKIKEYVSRPEYAAANGTSIDWLNWVLGGESNILTGISFSPYNIAVAKHPSRSGRAVMVWVEPGFNWDIENYNRFSESGINFIEDALKSDDFEREAREAIINTIRRVAENG